MYSGLDGQARQLEVKIVGNGAHHGVAFTHDGTRRIGVADIEPSRDQSLPGIGREKLGEVIDVQVSEPHLGHIGIL